METRSTGSRFLASEATSALRAGVTEPRAAGRLWATCRDNDTARVVAAALELAFATVEHDRAADAYLDHRRGARAATVRLAASRLDAARKAFRQAAESA